MGVSPGGICWPSALGDILQIETSRDAMEPEVCILI